MNSDNIIANLPTKYGDFHIMVWRAPQGLEPVALVTPNLDVTKPVLVRIHSECMTGDTFSSLRCDCGPQKAKALQLINESKNGVFIYLRQEGRGIGLFEKIRAYKLQEEGYDTHDANIQLGHGPDQRDYSIAKQILTELNVQKIKLITNNPSKVSELRTNGFDIVEQLSLYIRSNKYNKAYLETKKSKFKHFLNSVNSEYYFGISDVRTVEDVRAIVSFVKDSIKDPFLRITLGVSADRSSFTDKAKIENIKAVFEEANQHFPYVIPVLHFSFRNSDNYKNDLKEIGRLMPFVKRIQLNDMKKDHLSVLKAASRHMSVWFPMDHSLLSLLEIPEFVRIVHNKSVVLLLDNSKGTGKEEGFELYRSNIMKFLNKGLNNISIAGGFGPSHLDNYFDLRTYFKINISIDAESNLRSNDHLDFTKVAMYLEKLIHYYS